MELFSEHTLTKHLMNFLFIFRSVKMELW